MEGSQPDKVTTELAAQLDDPGADMVDVVVELASPPAAEAGPRADRIAAMKESFGREAKPVESVIVDAGGVVLGTAWINQTIRAKVPVAAVPTLSDVESVLVIDAPRSLDPEAG